ncbi:hypothetical protein JZ751_008488 [Albula glossodonta]|uniref:Uncharacterized protein n=1 Tax=Albula glossodonta TaxID=121402 RepID=A0A8T2MKT3_9TELE|nr:hypothetical protein JZ751_008488 [Albula glossodonta]
MLVLSSQTLLKQVGYYRLILQGFYLEVGAAALMLVLGPEHHYILALYLTTVISPLSSMVFGTNALFTKPAQSLAPMLVVSILNQFGYEKLKEASASADPSSLRALHSAMFSLVCLVPLCVAVVQILAWRPFSIQDSHTVDAKYVDT